MDRRTFLSCASVVAIGAFSGCTGRASDTGDGVILPRVELGNATNESQTFHLLIEFNDNIAHWDSYEVGPTFAEQGMGSEMIDPDLPDESGAVTAHVRIGSERASIDFEEEGYGDGDCVIATFLYGFRGEDQLSAHPVTVDENWGVSEQIACPPPDGD